MRPFRTARTPLKSLARSKGCNVFPSTTTSPRGVDRCGSSLRWTQRRLSHGPAQMEGTANPEADCQRHEKRNPSSGKTPHGGEPCVRRRKLPLPKRRRCLPRFRVRSTSPASNPRRRGKARRQQAERVSTNAWRKGIRSRLSGQGKSQNFPHQLLEVAKPMLGLPVRGKRRGAGLLVTNVAQ